MTLKEFSKKKNIIETLLSALNLIEEKTKITKIDFYPDFEIFEYDRHNDKEYYFTGIQTFDNNHNYVLDCEFISPFVFPYDRLDEIEEHEDIVFSDKENLIESVKELDDLTALVPTYQVTMDYLRHLGLNSVEELPNYLELHRHEYITTTLENS